jgi:hypothetical protein
MSKSLNYQVVLKIVNFIPISPSETLYVPIILWIILKENDDDIEKQGGVWEHAIRIYICIVDIS